MKQEKTKNKRRFIYYLILAICVLLLIAATVLTVYFVTAGKNPALDNPNNPENPNNPDDPDGPDQPSSGEAAFVLPVEYDSVVAVFYEEFENRTMDGWYYHHEGMDFAAAAGTEVRSIAAGTIYYMDANTELGNLIVVDHGEGLKSYYYFCEPVSGLAVGDSVAKGQKIGAIADAYGFEEFLGSHLHLEIEREDVLVDPVDYLKPVLEEK